MVKHGHHYESTFVFLMLSQVCGFNKQLNDIIILVLHMKIITCKGIKIL